MSIVKRVLKPRQRADYTLDEIEGCEHLLSDDHVLVLTAAVDGASYRLIAYKCVIPVNTVKSRLSRARAAIAVHLEEFRQQELRAKHEADEKTYPNGAPMYAPDGMMLDDDGNRSIFDDVDAGGSE